MISIRRDSNTITLATFWENHELKKYEFNPGYQRESVWSDEKQSFLIDSILKNIPIPPIFLHQVIDDNTGKTKYAVIDGKQRLTSIIRFIREEISCSTEDENSPLFDGNVSGIYFSDLAEEKFAEIRKQFWRYVIPIEYVDTSDKAVVDAIFDRLNRNGEPLSGQELRRANYYGTDLLSCIEQLARHNFWQERLTNVDVRRMENIEFVSELLFYMIINEMFSSDQSTLDDLYAKYSAATLQLDWTDAKTKFEEITNFISELDVNYDEYRVGGVSHLYALWCLACYCNDNSIPANSIKNRISIFYTELRNNPNGNKHLLEYKRSMSSATKMRSQRVRRFEALQGFILELNTPPQP